MERNSDFAERIKQYRKEQNITLAELEKITGIPAQTLNRYELKQRVPKIDTAITIAEKLKINCLWLQGFNISIDDPLTSAEEYSVAEKKLIQEYRSLNEEGKERLIEYVDLLKSQPKYKKDHLHCMVEKA